jgi:hypothetical protein
MMVQLPWVLFSFLILYPIGNTHWTRDESILLPLPTHRTTKTRKEHIQTSMTRVGFEPMSSVFEQAKAVHVLDRAATVTGNAQGIVLKL